MKVELIMEKNKNNNLNKEEEKTQNNINNKEESKINNNSKVSKNA